MRTRIKICGITRIEDALAVATQGADAIGFVFHDPSPRCVDIETARAISQQLPPFVTRVGLFVNAGDEQIRRALDAVPLDLLQFHGDEPPSSCERFGHPYIKAVAMREDVDLAGLAREYVSASALLLDNYELASPGGTGEVFDWSRIPADIGKPIILAGGLTPENVGEAIRLVHPYAVDVSSGVEKQKGIKDATLIAAFIQEVNKPA